MGWFNPKLEPGERVVLRYPGPLGRARVIRGVLLALLTWALSYMIVDWIAPNGVEAHNLILTFLLPSGFLGDMLNDRVWRVAVTDRRLMITGGWFGTRPWAATLDEVESVSIDHATYLVRIRAGGRETEIHPDEIDLQELTRALDAAKGTAP